MADQTPERQYGPQYKLIGKNYATPDEAYHALFLRRVQDLLES